MQFDLSQVQADWQSKAVALARDLPQEVTAREAVSAAARAGLLDVDDDLMSLVAAIEAIAQVSASAAVAIGMHLATVSALRDDTTFGPDLRQAKAIGALALSSDDVPVEAGGRLRGRASWIAPVANPGVAILGARSGNDLAAFAISQQAAGAACEAESGSGLRGLACGHLSLNDVPAVRAGETVPLMVRSRLVMAAVGLGIAQRALDEALAAARRSGAGDAGEQTVQGLLADGATELEAARLLTWASASREEDPSLGDASIAKLTATDAAQRAVERATQIVGVATLRKGHIVERLAEDVRALELFAGRTEALRAAVAADVLPKVG